MLPEVKALIEHFHLTPLPVENTYFVSVWRSSQSLADGAPMGTAMIGLYCNEPPSISRFHRLPVDEVWHFYGGDPIRLVLLYPDGSSKDVIMGSDVLKGQQLVFVIPAGVWQAGSLVEDGRYALYGCTMSPGFTSSMFEGGTCSQLLRDYPDRTADIKHLACPDDETSMPSNFCS